MSADVQALQSEVALPLSNKIITPVIQLNPRWPWDRELQLAKAAVLYADQVTVYSPGLVSAPLRFEVQAGTQDAESVPDFVRSLVARSRSKKAREVRQRIREMKLPPSQDAIDALLTAVTEFYPEAIGFEDYVNHPFLLPAIRAGYLQVRDLSDGCPEMPVIASHAKSTKIISINPDLTVTEWHESMDKLWNRLVQLRLTMAMAALARQDNFPLLDFSGVHFEEPPQEDRASSHTQLRHSDLGIRLVQTLPGFNKATMDEIVDIRRTLELPLIRFRAELARLASDLAGSPDSSDIDRTIADYWTSSVRPHLLEIEEKIQDDKYLRTLAETVVSDPKTALGGAGGALVGLAAGAPRPLLAALGASLGAAAMGVQSTWQTITKRREVRRHGFYFLYELSRRLDHR